MQFSTSDTIVAIATPPGRGGIGIVRISGPEAQAVARALIAHDAPLESRRATLTSLRRHAAELTDEIVVTLFPSPHSYTADDVVEISAHGSPVILHSIVKGAVGAGARLAQPGEFTLRAFVNGRIDLLQAEAVADAWADQAREDLPSRLDLAGIEDKITRLDGKFDTRMTQLDGKFDTRMTQLDGKFDTKIAQLDGKVDKLTWMVGFTLAGILAIIARLLLLGP